MTLTATIAAYFAVGLTTATIILKAVANQRQSDTTGETLFLFAVFTIIWPAMILIIGGYFLHKYFLRRPFRLFLNFLKTPFRNPLPRWRAAARDLFGKTLPPA